MYFWNCVSVRVFLNQYDLLYLKAVNVSNNFIVLKSDNDKKHKRQCLGI